MGVTSILSLLSGVALFLYGMSVMGDSLKKVAGNKLELILYKITSTPLKGILLGTASCTEQKVLLPVNTCMFHVVGVSDNRLGDNIDEAISYILQNK